MPLTPALPAYDPRPLDGHGVLVTGGAQGIGRAIVERFLDSGAAIAIWDRDIELAKKTAAELKSRGYIFASQTDTEVIAHLIDHLYNGDLLEGGLGEILLRAKI